MVNQIRNQAAETVVNAFIIVDQIYKHAYQVLMSLKEVIKADYEFKIESYFSNNTSFNEPGTWLTHFRGLYLAHDKIELGKYRSKAEPLLFLQASIAMPNHKEPVLRYGIIEKIKNFKDYKGARFDEYVRRILMQLHGEPKAGLIKTYYCEASIQFDEKHLLDIREDDDINTLAKTIADKYIIK